MRLTESNKSSHFNHMCPVNHCQMSLSVKHFLFGTLEALKVFLHFPKCTHTPTIKLTHGAYPEVETLTQAVALLLECLHTHIRSMETFIGL